MIITRDNFCCVEAFGWQESGARGVELVVHGEVMDHVAANLSLEACGRLLGVLRLVVEGTALPTRLEEEEANKV